MTHIHAIYSRFRASASSSFAQCAVYERLYSRRERNIRAVILLIPTLCNPDDTNRLRRRVRRRYLTLQPGTFVLLSSPFHFRESCFEVANYARACTKKKISRLKYSRRRIDEVLISDNTTPVDDNAHGRPFVMMQDYVAGSIVPSCALDRSRQRHGRVPACSPSTFHAFVLAEFTRAYFRENYLGKLPC